MYSIVLVMALTGSADVPAGHGCNGCGGCNGCTSTSCHGCNGCNGCNGKHGFFGGRHKSCNGCNGCHGCNGSSCHGCNGCNGCNGKHGFLGGLFKHKSCNGCNGCHGCNGCNGGCHGCTGCNGGGCNGAKPEEAKPEEAPAPEEKKKDVSAPATIVVTIPAAAKLTIDSNPTRSTDAVRTFVTPALEAGQDYYYSLQAEMVVDGETKTTTQRIMVRAGETSRVAIEFQSAVASE
jgi:uncharacterized protein (TIGR03000 family)